MGKVIGIDISKQTFDVCFLEKEQWQHKVLENKLSGFEQLKGFIEEGDWLVMEASGSYYYPLASYHHKMGVKVSVLNPLSVRRYSQSRLYRSKTDKKDARTIAEYGMQYPLTEWNPSSEENIHLKQLYKRITMLDKQIHQTQRQEEAFISSGCLDSFIASEIKKMLSYLKKQKEKLEKELETRAKQQYEESLSRLESIPGIGRKTAIMLLLVTDNFQKFENYKQLIAYVGLSPRIYQSGSSVKGKGHICKMGQPQLRKLLYLCSWSAKRVNETCRKMHERLSKKGKPERVIKIAIANKLLKQAFAIGKSGENYRINYC